MTAPPKWAQDLLLDAMSWAEEQGYSVPPLRLNWRRQHGDGTDSDGWSSGRAFYCPNRRIVVTVGRNCLDAKLVLLHELAHHLAPLGTHHGAAFWDIAWRLYRWAKLPDEYCLRREGHPQWGYRGATLAYLRAPKP